MGKIFTLTSDIIGIASDALDDLIDQLGKNCRLYFPPITSSCSNCTASAIGHKAGSVYLNGGPYPFSQGSICPLCGGDGTIAEEQSVTIKMLINWKVSKYDKSLNLDNIRLSEGMFKTKGYMSDLPNVLRCSYMVPHIEIDTYQHFKYKLEGEPISPGNIVQGRYFNALWKRVQ